MVHEPSRRLFLAITMPDIQRQVLHAALPPLSDDTSGVRWVPPENWHLTLIFFGQRSADEERLIGRAADSVCHTTAPFVLRYGGTGCFPQARHPRVLWVGLRTGGEPLGLLHANLHAALEQAGMALPEDSFSPHLTVGRLQKQATAIERSTAGRVWCEASLPDLPELLVREMLLIESTLGSGGPRYHTRAAFPLLGAR